MKWLGTELMPSVNDFLSAADKHLILEYAYAAVAYAVKTGRTLPVDLSSTSETLQQDGACFVTLKFNGKLRGCTGSIEAFRPLIIDVVNNAQSSARHDSRFRPVSISELPDLAVSVSVLTPRTEIPHSSEEDLLRKLRPGIDGLTIESPDYRAVFLPVMWEQLPESQDFLKHLKLKAGMPANFWPTDMIAMRFEAILIGDDH